MTHVGKITVMIGNTLLVEIFRDEKPTDYKIWITWTSFTCKIFELYCYITPTSFGSFKLPNKNTLHCRVPHWARPLSLPPTQSAGLLRATGWSYCHFHSDHFIFIMYCHQFIFQQWCPHWIKEWDPERRFHTSTLMQVTAPNFPQNQTFYCGSGTAICSKHACLKI